MTLDQEPPAASPHRALKGYYLKNQGRQLPPSQNEMQTQGFRQTASDGETDKLLLDQNEAGMMRHCFGVFKKKSLLKYNKYYYLETIIEVIIPVMHVSNLKGLPERRTAKVTMF